MGFVSRSLIVLLALYGLVFAVADAYWLNGAVPVSTAIVIAVVLIALQYLVAPWWIEFVFSIRFDDDSLPAVHREFVERLCKERGLPALRLGVIYSDTPNAFAYGRLRSDARVVVTEGLLKILTEDEVNAVLAHEVGHVAHYDFAVMALASLAPLLLYQLYVWTDRVNNLRIVSYGAYLAYWVGQFLVLLLNRTREYGADLFSAQVTREPSALSSALVKICYGMVTQRSELRYQSEKGTSSEHKKNAKRQLQLGQSMSLMGIAAAAGNDAMALGMNSPEDAARVMKWDLVNPWARFYELSSTHPLTAMRLRALNRESAKMGQESVYPLPETNGLRWIGFPVQFLFWALPLVCGFLIATWLWIGKDLRKIGFSLPENAMPWLLLALGVTWSVKIMFRYQGSFAKKQVRDLLEDLDVSQMRPRAVEVHGEVVGHGIPGAFWSPDLVLRDQTGLMFLYYRSSIPFGRFLFALRSADRLVGEQVTVKGWYRRGLKPYIEVAKVESRLMKAQTNAGLTTIFGGKPVTPSEEYETLVERSYSRWIQLAIAAACTTGAIIWLMATIDWAR